MVINGDIKNTSKYIGKMSIHNEGLMFREGVHSNRYKKKQTLVYIKLLIYFLKTYTIINISYHKKSTLCLQVKE